MILSRQEMQFYLGEDRKRYFGHYSKIKYYLSFLYSNNNTRGYQYMKSLRRLEYAQNCLKNRNIIGFICFLAAKLYNHHLGLKYNIVIHPNTIGYGFYIPHVKEGGGLILNCKHIGNYCSANCGVVVGSNYSPEMKPTIGDYVDMNIGCKIVGNVYVGNNVTVGPNTLIYKDVPDNCVVLGVPGKILRIKQN